MENVKFFELPSISQKSFYGKANILELKNGQKYLISYRTVVCMINRLGHVKRFWGGYSVTTMKHINEFLLFYGVPGGGAAWWRGLPIENKRKYIDHATE